MNESNYWAGEFLQVCINNWYWIILGWFALSCLVAPLIGRFCSLNTRSEEELDQQWMRDNYWTEKVQGPSPPNDKETQT